MTAFSIRCEQTGKRRTQRAPDSRPHPNVSSSVVSPTSIHHVPYPTSPNEQTISIQLRMGMICEACDESEHGCRGTSLCLLALNALYLSRSLAQQSHRDGVRITRDIELVAVRRGPAVVVRLHPGLGVPGCHSQAAVRQRPERRSLARVGVQVPTLSTE